MSTQLALAIAITAEAFKNKTDKGGQPYILHCLYVMNELPENDPDLRCAGVMHDLIEDNPDEWSSERLIKCGFNDRVVNTLKLLTHDVENVPYDEYIDAIAKNPDARLVKMADLRHNSDIHRMKGLRPKDFERLAKYHKAYAKLRDVIY